MTRNICIVAAMVMLLGACVWTYYATAPVQSLEVLSFRVTVNGPSGPPGMGLVRNAVGFASMFAFGIVAFCLASTLRSKQSTEQLSRAGSSLVCLAGVNTIVAGGISFFSMSAVLRAFLEFASSPIAPKEAMFGRSSIFIRRFCCMEPLAALWPRWLCCWRFLQVAGVPA